MKDVFESQTGINDSRLEFEPTSFPYEMANLQVKEPTVIRPKTNDSSTTVKSNVCFFMHSEGFMPPKPRKLQEEVLLIEQWEGPVISVGEKTIIADVQNVSKKEQRLRLRIDKEKIEGSDVFYSGMSLNVVMEHKRNFQGVLRKNISVRVRKPLEVPDKVMEREFEERVNRLSYLFK